MPRLKTGRGRGRPTVVDAELSASDYVALYRMLELAKGQTHFQLYSLAGQVIEGKSNIDRLVYILKKFFNYYSYDKSKASIRFVCEAIQQQIESRLIYSCLTQKEARVLDEYEDVIEKLQYRANEVATILEKPALDIERERFAELYGPGPGIGT